MSKQLTFFEFSLRVKNHRTNRGLTNNCNLCQIVINLGDKVCSKYSNGRKNRIYHIDCAKKVNLL